MLEAEGCKLFLQRKVAQVTDCSAYLIVYKLMEQRRIIFYRYIVQFHGQRAVTGSGSSFGPQILAYLPAFSYLINGHVSSPSGFCSPQFFERLARCAVPGGWVVGELCRGLWLV